MLDALTLPAPLAATDTMVRRATPQDLPALMALLADDPISAARGDVASPEDETAYRAALEAVLAAPGNDLLVVVDAEGTVIGTLQLTLIPGMARRGSTRLLVEAVRVAGDRRSGGVGSALMRWTTDVVAPALGVGLVQLTSDAQRTDAHRFYPRLGFIDSHIGFTYRVRA